MTVYDDEAKAKEERMDFCRLCDVIHLERLRKAGLDSRPRE